MWYNRPVENGGFLLQYNGIEMDIDLNNLDLDIDDAALAEKIEAKLQEDEVEIEAINDCESGACAI